MRIAESEADFEDALATCKREAMASFSDDNVLIEKYVVRPRHVEFQVFADKYGDAVHLFERDCSVQRRHQKVLEEAPAPGMTPELRAAMGESAVAAAKAVGYQNAGTVEFILTPDNQHYFMEMNTRLQVEHPVSELVSGVDLVEWQLKAAAGHPLPKTQDDLQLRGHALEARIYAERPGNNFLPATGTLQRHSPPPSSDSVRVDSGITEGDTISTYYDPMIAKLITYGEDRTDALVKMDRALEQYHVVGLPTNIAFLRNAVRHPAFQKGGVDTSFLEEYAEDVLPEASPAPAHVSAIAALGQLLEAHHATAAKATTSSDKHSPWVSSVAARPTGRLHTTMRMTDHAGQEVQVVLQDPVRPGAQFSVTVGDETFDVSADTEVDEEGHLVHTFDFGDVRVSAGVVPHTDGAGVTVLPHGVFPRKWIVLRCGGCVDWWVVCSRVRAVCSLPLSFSVGVRI